MAVKYRSAARGFGTGWALILKKVNQRPQMWDLWRRVAAPARARKIEAVLGPALAHAKKVEAARVLAHAKKMEVARAPAQEKKRAPARGISRDSLRKGLGFAEKNTRDMFERQKRMRQYL